MILIFDGVGKGYSIAPSIWGAWYQINHKKAYPKTKKSQHRLAF
jgi:hypothetical protein